MGVDMGIQAATDITTATPIFVVGSPRSGTSILTWCLGQHPNILPLEESDWIGPFAVSAGAHYATGSARGERSQLSAQAVTRADFLRRFGNAIDQLIRDHRARLEHNSWLAAQRDPQQVSAEFALARDVADPKARWVDGTPEYSLYICGLQQLFPAAKFVHIVREVDDVVASLLGFRQDDGSALVASVEEACAYWLRTTSACVEAEQALGAQSIRRIRYRDLVETPEAILRRVLEFLGEPYAPACIEPLVRRINSSRPPGGEDGGFAACVSAQAGKARALSTRMQQDAAPAAPSPQAHARWQAGFEQQVKFAHELPGNYRYVRAELERLSAAGALPPGYQLDERQLAVAKLRRGLNLCGVLLAAQLLLAAGLYVCGDVMLVRSLWLAVSLIGAFVYAWLRRAGARRWLARIFGRRKAE